jgi:hypothetical protein
MHGTIKRYTYDGHYVSPNSEVFMEYNASEKYLQSYEGNCG